MWKLRQHLQDITIITKQKEQNLWFCSFLLSYIKAVHDFELPLVLLSGKSVVQNRKDFCEVSIFHAAMFGHPSGDFLRQNGLAKQGIFQCFSNPEPAAQEQAVFGLFENMGHFRMPNKASKSTNMTAHDQWNLIFLHTFL